MSSMQDRKEEAKQFRKAGEYQKALEVYRSLFKDTKDQYDAAGFLHCLRKPGKFDEALPLAERIAQQYPSFEWGRKEVIWTRIQGLLEKYGEDTPHQQVVETAESVMGLNPDWLATKRTVFKVLKSAKINNDWDCINNWIVKIDPDKLSVKPLEIEDGREGWCDQALWYNYRINGLLKIRDPAAAIKLADMALIKFSKQRKFFQRLKGLALWQSGDLTASERIYADLCKGHKSDWWLLHEYSKLVKEIGRKMDALNLMYRAATSNSKLDLMVKLFADIGSLCMEIGKHEVSRSHYLLCKFIREEKGWPVSFDVSSNIERLNRTIETTVPPENLKRALDMCKAEWKVVLGLHTDEGNKKFVKRDKRLDLEGKVSLGHEGKPFCFINTRDNLRVYCLKSDLPAGIKHDDVVVFDALPSYDKKKGQESWKACNVRKYNLEK